MDPKFPTARGLRPNHTARSPASQPNETLLRLSGIHVLVVDDEPENREALQSLLEHSGSRITTAANVTEAIAQLEHDFPDVLLSDINMPGEDGYDLIRRVRARSKIRGGRVPAAALTGRHSGEDRRRALQAGFTKHVVKPVDPEELITIVYSLARIAA